MRLKDKVAIVTGASQGYGMETARGFAKEGADVAICSRGIEKLEMVAQRIQSETGRKVVPIKTDITKKNEVETLFEKTLEAFGKVDILVNNAGIYSPVSILDLKEEDMEQVFSVNLRGCFFCTQAAARQMVKQGGGKIISIASSQGRVGFGLMSHYSATKGGIIAATRDWAVELAQHNILVNCVAMGVFPSEELKKTYPPEFLEGVRQQTILKKLGEPKDVVPILIFLASNESDYMTGQTISYDCGLSMP